MEYQISVKMMSVHTLAFGSTDEMIYSKWIDVFEETFSI